MARATIKKYRRKTMKSKSNGKKLRLKKTLKLKPKRRNIKKTQKCFRLKNKKRNVKKNVKRGGDTNDGPPSKSLFTTVDANGDKKFDGPGFMKAIQDYNKKKISDMQVEDPDKYKVQIYRSDTGVCTNVDPSFSDVNELGKLDEKYLKFKFEGQDHIYCYNYSDLEGDLNNIGNICCVWKKTNTNAPDNSEGYGTSCVVKNTRNLLNNVCDYINDTASKLETEGHEFVDDINNYLCVWRSLINVRTWISHDAIKTINNYKDKDGTFILKKKQNDRMIIGNLYNVFGVGMLHGQKTGEMIYDIDFEPSVDNISTTYNILKKDKLLNDYDEIYNQFWNAPSDPDLDDSFVLNDSTDSPVSVFRTPDRTREPNSMDMSPISPNRQLFDDSPIPSIQEELENSDNRMNIINSSFNTSLTFDTLSPSWINMEDVLQDLDTTGSHYRTPPVVSIPTNGSGETPTTDGFVYLSPGSNLRPRSAQIGNTFDILSDSPHGRSPPRGRSRRVQDGRYRGPGPGPFPETPPDDGNNSGDHRTPSRNGNNSGDHRTPSRNGNNSGGLPPFHGGPDTRVIRRLFE
jgi:hypothetical protein